MNVLMVGIASDAKIQPGGRDTRPVPKRTLLSPSSVDRPLEIHLDS
jgi:hypothetical protein